MKGSEDGEEHPDLVRLGLRRPTLGARVRTRVASDPMTLGQLAEQIVRDPRQARIACECEDVLVAEIRLEIDAGVRSLAEIALRTGLGTGVCGGARCLDAVALEVAARSGRRGCELRDEAATLLLARSSTGPDRGLARISLAYARLGDDVSIDAEDDGDPEVIVNGRGRRR